MLQHPYSAAYSILAGLGGYASLNSIAAAGIFKAHAESSLGICAQAMHALGMRI